MAKRISALEELFSFSYKLRRAGLDPTTVKTIVDAFLMGSNGVEFNIEDGKLTPAQMKTIEIFKENGFDVVIHDVSVIVTYSKFDDIRKKIDESFIKESKTDDK